MRTTMHPPMEMRMRFYTRQSALLLGVWALIGCGTSLGHSVNTVDAHGIQCTVVHGWPQLREGEALGQVTGVGIDGRGAVFVFHRAGRIWSDPFPSEPIDGSTVWVFDGSTGQLLDRWGADLFIMPHGLTVDPESNVWVTDVGTHQVHMFTADGRLLMTLGEPGVPGADRSRFNLPTDVAVGSDGVIYVSDGYANARVVRFGPRGEYLCEWGGPGTGPGEFDLPHSIALDDRGHVYVADRGNARVQVFDSVGVFLGAWSDPALGRPYAVFVSESGYVLTVDGGDQPESPPDRSSAAILDRSGVVLHTFGRYGNYDGQFQIAHDIVADAHGAVYVGDAWGERVQKFAGRNIYCCGTQGVADRAIA